MNLLNPQPSFVWPEPRVLAEMCTYDHQPPFGEVVLLIEAMNVADDALCRDLRNRGIKDRCRDDLDLLSRIEKEPLESRQRCELARRVLSGDSIAAIDETLKNFFWRIRR